MLKETLLLRALRTAATLTLDDAQGLLRSIFNTGTASIILVDNELALLSVELGFFGDGE